MTFLKKTFKTPLSLKATPGGSALKIQKMPTNQTTEIKVLRDVVEKLHSAGLPYMLTGSFALGYYAQPRMTRDVDIVLAVKEKDIETLVRFFDKDYYISEAAVNGAVKHNTMFNIIHNKSFIKIDFIVKKNEEYRGLEFERRQKVDFMGLDVFIVSKEDLILSKMLWAKDSKSELQFRDIKNLITSSFDKAYLDEWIKKLGLEGIWAEIIK